METVGQDMSQKVNVVQTDFVWLIFNRHFVEMKQFVVAISPGGRFAVSRFTMVEKLFMNSNNFRFTMYNVICFIIIDIIKYNNNYNNIKIYTALIL